MHINVSVSAVYLGFTCLERAPYPQCGDQSGRPCCSAEPDCNSLRHEREGAGEPFGACYFAGITSIPSSTAAVCNRSEERRVGKECRYQWARDEEKKKNRTTQHHRRGVQ